MAGEAVKIVLIITALLFSAGCERKAVKMVQVEDGKQAVAVEESQLTREQKIKLLRTEAKKRGLAFKVVCLSWVEEGNGDFLGVAWNRGVEDTDQTDRWMEEGNSQEEATYALYHSIQGAPTHLGRVPGPGNKGNVRTRKMCPPALRGD